MPSSSSSNSHMYENEFAVTNVAKIVCAGLAFLFWIVPHYALFQNDASWSSENGGSLPMACAISIGSLSLSLAIRISMLRTEMNTVGSKKLIINTNRFQRWYKTQMNHFEYAPYFVSLLLFREYMSVTLHKELSTLAVVACYMSLIGNYTFVLTSGMCYNDPMEDVNSNSTSTTEKLLRQFGFTKFWRMNAVSLRYVALGLLLIDISLEGTGTNTDGADQLTGGETGLFRRFGAK